MKTEALLPDSQVAIFGLGLMGGSLALSLQGKCAGLLGIDPSPVAREMAARLEVVDRVLPVANDIALDADVVILAAPVKAILRLLEDLPQMHLGQAVVLDLGSTKEEITQRMQDLPERFDPLGGHPMCGKERSGLENAVVDLYHGAVFALSPLSRTSPRARLLAEEIVEAVGAHPVWVDPAIHDRWVAATSHVPYLMANALAAATPVEAQPLVGPGFRSSARLAGQPVGLFREILESNRWNVLHGLRQIRERLSCLEQSIETSDWKSLELLLTEGQAGYEKILERGNS